MYVNFCPELQDIKQTENFYSVLLVMEAQGILTLVRGLVDTLSGSRVGLHGMTAAYTVHTNTKCYRCVC